jgi:hypothetical protein
MSRALDYATRMAMGNVVAEEMRGAALLLQTAEPQARQLHGPCSIAAEEFVIGSVLASPQTPIASRSVSISKRRRARERERAPLVDPRALGLKPSDFWAHLSQRYWLAMLEAPDPTDIQALVDWLADHERITGPRELFTLELEGYRAAAVSYAALYDVSSACVLILNHARSRRLVGLLARLADGICDGSEDHESAMLALREHFVAERGPVIKPA